ncbi:MULTISPECIES: BglG family transcription antiterminator [Lacticaseibacillus]|uniref:BglG family transcription antiterminator n=1 Tax=Lacticaseibacillus TaxID=2759736 RepID=UPI00063D8BB1|nr:MULTISPECIES: transcription antiterminator [Lacticaseibacillus]KLI75650.1 transcriptional antiterminator [Lacticaseibacillus casei]
MPLSNRQRQLVLQLLNAEGAVTAKQLAESAGVSVRTVKYDLADIREWLAVKGSALKSAPRKGIWIEAGDAARAALREKIDEQIADHYLAPNERIIRMILILAQTSDYTTQQQFQARVNVSQTTVNNDLKKLAVYLQQFNVKLISKNYYGYRLNGTELDICRLLEQLITQQLNRKTLMAELVDSLSTRTEPKRAVILTGEATFDHAFNTILKEAIRLGKTETHMPDPSELIATIIRLTIGVIRQGFNQLVNSYHRVAQSQAEQDFTGKLIMSTLAFYNLPALTDDIAYYLGQRDHDQPAAQDHNLVAMTHRIILAVGALVDHDFSHDSQLQENLYLHLSQSLGKHSQLLEYSPFTQDIKQEYPDLFTAIEKTVNKELANDQAVLSEAFVSFIALHFMVSLNRDSQMRTVRVAYVCATGIGITNLIQQRIASAIPNIELVGFASIDDARALIAREQPELVISVFPLKNVDVQVIEVQPLPNATDIAAIRQAVAKKLQVPLAQIKSQHPVVPIKPKPNLEQQTQQTILTMFSIFSELKLQLPAKIDPYYGDAFMMHVFLAVQRIMFNKQYQGKPNHDDPKLVGTVEHVFSDHGLAINRAEVHAILEYLSLSHATLEKGDDTTGSQR